MSTGWNSTRGLLGQLAANWRPFLAIHLAVVFVVMVLLSPLSALLLRLLVLLSGDPALSDQDILFFVLSPAGFLALLVLVAIGTIGLLGTQIAAVWTDITTRLRDAIA